MAPLPPAAPAHPPDYEPPEPSAFAPGCTLLVRAPADAPPTTLRHVGRAHAPHVVPTQGGLGSAEFETDLFKGSIQARGAAAAWMSCG